MLCPTSQYLIGRGLVRRDAKHYFRDMHSECLRSKNGITESSQEQRIVLLSLCDHTI